MLRQNVFASGKHFALDFGDVCKLLMEILLRKPIPQFAIFVFPSLKCKAYNSISLKFHSSAIKNKVKLSEKHLSFTYKFDIISIHFYLSLSLSILLLLLLKMNKMETKKRNKSNEKEIQIN